MSLEHTLTRMFKVITDIHTFFGISGKYFCLEVWWGSNWNERNEYHYSETNINI